MTEYPDDQDDPKILNVLQIVAFQVISTVFFFGLGLTNGASWVVAFFSASIGGVGATILCAGLYYHVHIWRQRRATKADRPPASRRFGLSDAAAAWEADRVEDAMASRMAGTAGNRAEAQATTIADLLHLWNQDARVETLEAERARLANGQTDTETRRQRGS